MISISNRNMRGAGNNQIILLNVHQFISSIDEANLTMIKHQKNMDVILVYLIIRKVMLHQLLQLHGAKVIEKLLLLINMVVTLFLR